VFSRAQPRQPNNPKKATYGANWKAVLKEYPQIKGVARTVHKKIKAYYGKKGVNTKKMSLRIPFTRLCVPSEYGLKRCGLKKGTYNGRVNPNGYRTDKTSPLFIKFYYDGKKIVTGKTGR